MTRARQRRSSAVLAGLLALWALNGDTFREARGITGFINLTIRQRADKVIE